MMSQIQLIFGESNPHKNNLVEEWVMKNVDYTQLKKQLPVCFYGNASYYQSELPDFSGWPADFKARVYAVLVDMDMRADLEGAGVINWSRNVGTIVPITVPKDGNCLLHSIAVSVWGILDRNLMLRRLLQLVTQTDKSQRFYSRWLYHQHMQISLFGGRRPDPEAEAREWAEISSCLDPNRSGSFAAPHRFLESIHVYTLANILRRPIIIMTDPTMRAFSGFSLQDNDMGGIYLPLEWSWNDTSKTPILIGYSQSHFCPLLFSAPPNQSSSERREVAALVNAQLEQLPVRYLLKREEPLVGELLRKYLKVKETVATINGAVQNILCAGVEIHKLPPEMNLMNDFFKDFYNNCAVAQHYDVQTARVWQAGQAVTQAPLQPVAPQARHLRQHYLGQHSVPTQRERLQGGQSHEYGMGDPSLHAAPLYGHGSVRIPPPSINPRLTSLDQNASLNVPQEKKCLVPSCKYFGDPDLAMMCSSCFRNYSIKESRDLAAGMAQRALPSAPLASIQAEEQPPALSMMVDKCKNRCGYRCSTKTYPFCHECYNANRQAEERARKAAEAQHATGPLITPGSPTGAAASVTATVTPFTSHPPATLTQEILTPTPASQGQAGGSVQPSATVNPTESGQPQAATTSPGDTPSPTRALAAANLSAPLTPPNDLNDLMLFGSGPEPSPMQPGNGAPAQEVNISPLPQQKHQAAEPQKSLLEFTGSPTGQISEPPAASSTQHQQLEPARDTTFSQQQQLLSSKLTNSTLATVAGGIAGNELPFHNCKTPGCERRGEFQLENLCGECFMKKGVRPATAATGAPNPQVQNLKTGFSLSNSAPASIGPGAAGNVGPSPASKDPGHASNFSRASSLTHLPNKEPPLSSSNKNYVQNWLNKNKPPAPSQVKAQPVGLPEKQEGEQLSGTDLLASGEACQSYTERCIGNGCNNEVVQGQQLCRKCQDILGRMNQGQAAPSSRTSAQGSLPSGPQLCRTEDCNFCGDVNHLGYCSRCYSQQVKLQQEVENRQSAQQTAQRTIPAPSASASATALPPNIQVPPNFKHVHLPQGRQGQHCKRASCNMFGDPKQLGLCGKHYHEHISSSLGTPENAPLPPQTASYAGSQAGAPSSPHHHHHTPHQPQQAQQAGTKRPHAPSTTITLPFSSQVRVTPNSALIITPSGTHDFVLETVPSSGSFTSQGSDRTLPMDEIYPRVVSGRVKCKSDYCENFGNSSKGGLCNSCAEERQRWDDEMGLLMYGEEQTG